MEDIQTGNNTRALFAFICGQMAKLDNKEITANEAVAQAKLASQACNLLNYELKRVVVQSNLARINSNIKDTDITLREIESK